MTPTFSIRLLLPIAALAVACSSGGGGGSGDKDEAAASSALTSTFLTSTSGTSTIGAGDTVQFEVAITTEVGRNYDTILFSLTGDATGNEGAMAPWAGVMNTVTAWSWNYEAGTTDVNFSIDSAIAPTDNSTLTTLPVAVSIGWGSFGFSRIGSGVPSIVGTVTITADTVGVHQGGAFFLTSDGFVDGGISDSVTISTGTFTVVGP